MVRDQVLLRIAKQMNPALFKVTQKTWADKPRPFVWGKYVRAQRRQMKLVEAVLEAAEAIDFRVSVPGQAMTDEMDLMVTRAREQKRDNETLVGAVLAMLPSVFEDVEMKKKMARLNYKVIGDKDA